MTIGSCFMRQLQGWSDWMSIAASHFFLPQKHSFISIAPKHSKCPNQFRIRFLAGHHMWCTADLGPQPSAMTHSLAYSAPVTSCQLGMRAAFTSAPRRAHSVLRGPKGP